MTQPRYDETSHNDVMSVSDNEASQDWHAAKGANAREIRDGDTTGAMQRAILASSTGGWGGYYLHKRARKKYLAEQNKREAAQQQWNELQGRQEQANVADEALRNQIMRYQQQLGGRALDPQQLQVLVQQYQMNKRRQALAGGVDAYYANPELQASRKNYVEQMSRDALGALQAQTRDASRTSAFVAASRGQGGSSMDIERKARVGNARDMGAAQIAGAGQQALDQFAANDRATRQEMLDLIYGAGPEEADQLQTRLAGLRRSDQMGQERDAMAGIYDQIRRGSQQALQGAIAGGMNSFAGGIRRSSESEGA